MGRRHALIFISERSRLPVLIPIRQADRLRTVFPEAVCQMLASAGVSGSAIADERLRMSQMAFGPTRSRSLLGTLNDSSFGGRVHFMTARDESLDDIARVGQISDHAAGRRAAAAAARKCYHIIR